MSLERYNFKPSASATKAAIRRDSLFISTPKEGKIRVRFLPPAAEGASIFIRNCNHFKFKDGDKGTSLACLGIHGTESTGSRCGICDICSFLKANGDKEAQKLLKGRDAITQSTNYYSQVLLRHEDETYTGPHLFRLPQSGVDAVQTIMEEIELVGTPYFTDIEEGFDLLIQNLPASPFYKAMRTKPNGGLDTIYPGWEQKLIRDVYGATALRIETREDQIVIAKATYGDLIDWEHFSAVYA